MSGTSLAKSDVTSLPDLVDRTANTLVMARTSAQILEARDHPGVTYDVAKVTARLAEAKQAHDDVLAAVHRAQVDTLKISDLAKEHLATAYDVAGQVAGQHCYTIEVAGEPVLVFSAEDMEDAQNQLDDGDRFVDHLDFGVREDGRCVWDRVNRFALSVRLATDIEAEAWRASRNVILAENRILHDVNDRRLAPDEFWILYLIPAKEGDPNLVANSQAMAIYEHVMGLDVACITPSDFWDQIDSFHRDWTIQWIGTSLRLLKNLAEEHGRRYPPEGERPIRLVKG